MICLISLFTIIEDKFSELDSSNLFDKFLSVSKEDSNILEVTKRITDKITNEIRISIKVKPLLI